MRKTLLWLAVVEVVALVGVLAGYLIAIAATLRRVSQALGRVTFGVRAIERQTEPIGAALRAVNADLDAVAGALEASGGGRGSAGQRA